MSDSNSHRKGAAFEASESTSAIRHLSLPDVIDGRYRVLGRVGAGGMGVVLRAEDLFLERPVAIKIVDQSSDPSVGQRFVKEAQALAQVRHENIVQVYAFGPFQTSAYLAMELVVGESLETLIDSHAQAGTTVPLPRAISILRAIGQGLEAVHARQLVHRDVKPGNIIVEKNTDRPVLIDFGLARRRSKSSPKLSITGGTPSYMAPEQARDPEGNRVTARTDLYAFACTAFELFTGRPVFEGTDIYSVLVAHMSDPPRRVSSLRPELAAIDDVLERALSKEPLDRHSSISEMMTALDAAFARVGASKPEGPRTLVFAADGGLRRSLARNATNTLRTHGHDIRCDTAESASEAAVLMRSKPYELVILDEESTGGRLVELVRLAKDREHPAEVVIVSRDLPAVTHVLGETRIRHLVPKPVNVHVLAAVLGRLALVKQPSPSEPPSRR